MPIAHSDEIAVFDSVGNCYGFGFWPKGPDTTFPVWGYNSLNVDKPGMIPGATMHFRVWDTTLGEMPAAVTYYPTTGPVPFPPKLTPNTCSTFVAGNPIAYSVPSSITGYLGPAAPALSSPSNGAVNQALAPSLAWGSSAGATSFSVQVSLNSSFRTIVSSFAGLTAQSSGITGLANGTTYYWRASAANFAGTGPWSGVWSFTTVFIMPAAPTPSLPSDNAVNQPSQVTLSWSSVANATSFTVQVSTVSTFSTTVYGQADGVAPSQVISGLLPTTTYYWRVNALNADFTSAWSTVWTFTTGLLPGTPVLTAPTDNATNLPSTVTLSWASVSGAVTYALQTSTVTDFSIVTQIGTIAATSQQVSGLAPAANYYWRVNAVNGVGSGPWSTVWTFATGSVPAAPALSSPTNGAGNQPVSLTLTWLSSANASTYTVQAATSSSFTATVSSQSATTVFAPLGGLASNATFYWRAAAANSFGASAWSAVWNFKTVNTVPVAPVLIYPANNAAGELTNLTISWTSGSGGGVPVSYGVQVSSTSEFTSFVYNGDTASTLVALRDLGVSTTYYWRINGVNSAGMGAWSETWSFTTISAPPAVPVLTAPTDNAKTLVSLNLDWLSATGASSYTVQLATVSAFSSFTQDTTTKTAVSFNSLLVNTTYYWRVSATNVFGASAWSGIWSFTTQLPVSVLPFGQHAKEGASFLRSNEAVLYSMPQACGVKLTFCDIRGKTLTGLDAWQNAGNYRIPLARFHLAAGVYMVRFTAGNYEKAMVMVVRDH